MWPGFGESLSCGPSFSISYKPDTCLWVLYLLLALQQAPMAGTGRQGQMVLTSADLRRLVVIPEEKWAFIIPAEQELFLESSI